MERIAILGSGMAGFGAAHRFHTEGHRATLYEKRPYHGGHTASYAFDNGFELCRNCAAPPCTPPIVKMSCAPESS